MINLTVLHILFLEISILSMGEKLAPFVWPIFSRVLLIYQLLQRLDLSFMRKVEEEWNREPFFLRVDHHSVFHTLICIIAPNLHKQLQSSNKNSLH